ncbi:putative NAD dependent epimerase/dehydratase [Cladophialophora carrionii]|uniref:Putative NAD dependent epimerase/dehydratase n=1 Tax=Cladophialophora carrionii TaxID=86049 RepID=A0A1C1CXE7_9EURO|nr:putative NAD dependent epimerase/dehydratase [Cladophialophora carrionii]
MSPPTVLLTGATGSLGASTLAHLLSDTDFAVVATLRSSAKSEPFLRSKYAAHVSSGRLSFVEIPDMTAPHAFDGPASSGGVDAIIHIATPLAYDDVVNKVIKPSWTIVHNVLIAAEKSRRVKRVVMTGSLVATMRIPEGLFAGGSTISEADWNPITRDEAGANPSTAYQYSKVHAEKEAWKFMNEQPRAFDLIFLLAPSITGRSLQGGFKPEKGHLGGQPGLNTGLFDVERPGFLFPMFADVEDVARVHVEALSPRIPGNQRYLFHSPELMAPNPIAAAIREEFPQLRDRVPAPDEGSGSGEPANLVKTDQSRFESAFGKRTWKSARLSALETVQDIVDYERRSEKQAA